MRAAIYARYSSDLQSDSSIEDQVEVCRRYAELKGWAVSKIYSDAAISGASTQRPGYQAMQADARRNLYDVVVAESLDRLSRRVADVAALHDELLFNGRALHTVATGEISALLAGVLGAVSQQYLLDLKEKTKRGLLGRVLKGRSGGGIAYGYRVDEAETGLRVVIPEEAEVVRRIFRDFADGLSPRAIAKALNAGKIGGPEGRPWRDTTIRGQRDRGTGILNNELYLGRLVWNRCSYVKDPRTGKRLARPNPESQWESVDVPELRIVDDTLWQAVKDRQAGIQRTMARDADGNALNRAHRRKFLLSGLLHCGICGGGFTIVAQDRYGCANRRSAGICPNNRTIDRHELEHRVLSGLQSRLMAPDLVSVFIDEFMRALKEEQEQTRRQRDDVEQRRRAVQKKIDGLIKAIEDGLYSPSLKERLLALEAERDTLAKQAADDEPPVVSIHPNLGQIYQRKVRDLVEALNDRSVRAQAAEQLRGLIERLVLIPRADEDGLAIEIHGDLVTLLDFAAGSEVGNDERPGAFASGRRMSVVAGARNSRFLRLVESVVPRLAA
jgi:DNA invertase Pin-like site-specific DNA recombinase